MTSGINIGIVGLDNWYFAVPFAELAARRGNITLKAVSEPDATLREWMASRYRIPAYAEHEKVVSNPSIDALIIAARTSQHAELIESAVAEGKHILCIKPLEVDVERAKRAVQIVRRAKTVFCMGFPWRAEPLFQEAKRLISAGAIGECVCIMQSGKYPLPRRAPGVEDPGWYAQKEYSGGGGFLDHAVHQVDMLRWWLEDEVESVSCRVSNQMYKSLGVEDYGVAILRFAGGAIATIESSWVSHQSTVGVIEVQGTKGFLRIDLGSRTMEVHNLRGVSISYMTKRNLLETPDLRLYLDVYEGLFDSFIDCIIRGGEPLSTVEDGWAATAVMTAAYESAMLKKEVAVPSLE